MKKNVLMGTGIVLLIIVIIIFAVKFKTQMIIQGEVDTKTIDLSSKITGRVQTLNVKKGDFVQKGQILVVLDTPDIVAKTAQAQAALELAESKALEVKNGARVEQRAMALNALNKAKSDLELAEKTYGRLSRLNNEGVISNQRADEAKTAYENAKQGVLIAQNNYDMLQNGSRYEDKLMAASLVKKAEGAKREAQSYLNENVIIAPISGQITEVAVEEGELVGAGYTIISIVDVTDNWVVFNLREDLLRGIKVGTEFNVKIPAISNNNIRVRVNYISQMGNFATWRATKIRGDFDLKTFEVHAKPLIPLPDLRAGMSVITYINKK